MYAIIESCGKQYKVAEGDVVFFEKLDAEEGKKVSFDKVVLVSDDKKVEVGAPYVKGVKVEGKVLANGKGKKIVIYRYKAKKNERRTQGHRQPFTKVEITSIKVAADQNLTEDIIKKFHKILKEGTMDSRKEWFNVGDYKKLANEAGNMKTSSPKQTPKDMQKLMEWYNSLPKVTIKEIIEFHARFEKIHPFQDGNGRVGRIIAFKECLKNNIIPFIILDKDKLYYYRGLKEYQNKTEKGYLIDTCLNAQDEYTKMIEYYLK